MPQDHDDYPKGRLDAFADGVLAIVITLLVLELKVPGVGESSRLWHALGHEWRDYAGYLTSFVFVGGVWIVHSNATSYITRGDAILFRLNLVMLFFVSLTPFFASLMTTHLGRSGGEIAVALYGLNLAIGSAMLSAFIRYAGHHPYLGAHDLADNTLREIERRRRVIIVLLTVSVILALLVPNLAVALYLCAALAFVVEPLIAARRARRSFDRAAAGDGP